MTRALGKYAKLSQILAITVSEAYNMFIAGAIFDEDAARLALDNDILLSYPDGSRYSVDSAANARDDLNGKLPTASVSTRVRF